MNARMLVWSLAVSSACTGSPSDPPRPALGTERADCRPAQDRGAVGTCDPGLLCLSNLCVRPPPADCRDVGEHVASLELGNYAEPEARAPVVDRYRRACEKGLVSKEQGACITQASDRWAVRQCAPSMFPELEGAGAGDCARVVERIADMMRKQLPDEPQNQRLVALTVEVMTKSCTEDGWPDELKTCIVLAEDGEAGIAKCNEQMPPSVQEKLNARLQEAMTKFATEQTQLPPSP